MALPTETVERPRTRTTRATVWLAGAALAAAPLATAAYIASFGVNAVYADHVGNVVLFDAMSRGALTAKLAFGLANEHRIFFPHLLFLALGRITRFNNVAEMYAGLALMVACGFMLYAAYAREWPSRAQALCWFLPAGLLLFTWRQNELLLRGDALPTTYLVLLGVFATLLLLDRAERAGPAFAGALAAATFASFSYLNGLLVWPIGALLLLFAQPRRPRYALLVIWLLVGAAVTATYFHGYTKPPQHPSLLFFARAPFAAIAYVLAAGGGALAATRDAAIAVGAVLCVLNGAAIAATIQSVRAGRRAPWGIWLIAFGTLSEVMIAVGRSGMGVDQALSSRYAPFSMTAVIGCWFVFTAPAVRESMRTDRLRVALLAVALPSVVAGVVDGVQTGRVERQNRRQAAYVLMTARFQADETLELLHPGPRFKVRSAADVLERLRLNVYAEPRVDPAVLASAPAAALMSLDLLNSRPIQAARPMRVGSEAAVWLNGWAVDPMARRCPAAVFVVIDGGRLVIPALLELERPDVAAALHEPAYRRSGFAVSFAAGLLAPGAHALRFTVVTADGRRAMAGSSFTIVRAAADPSSLATPFASR